MAENGKTKPTDNVNLFPILRPPDALPQYNEEPTAPPLSAPKRQRTLAEYPPPYSIMDPLQAYPCRNQSLPNAPVTTQLPSSIYEFRRASLHDYLNQRNALVHPLSSTTLPFGTESVRRKCPYCHQTAMTIVTHSPNMCTYLSSLMLCCLGLNCGCCLIPFCLDGCNDIEHRCAACGGYLGRYSGC